MLKLEVRPAPSRVMSVASPLLALGLTVLIGIVLFMLLGKDPMRGLYVSQNGMAESLGQAQVLPYLRGLVRHGVEIDLVSFELERESRVRRTGPTAEALLRRLGTVGSRIA